MVASILKIVITRNTICDILVGFPKSGHIYILIEIVVLQHSKEKNLDK